MRFGLIIFLLFCRTLLAASFTAATYNLEFYFDKPALNMPAKSETARGVIRQSIKELNADVIALQEVGSTNALHELRNSLAAEGVDYPYMEHVRGRDAFLHLAFLSRFPIKARRHHTNESYLHQGRRFYVARGFGEIEVELPGSTRVTFITAHLKSQRIIAEADQQELREEEAILLREKIDAFFAKNPGGHLVVLGDLNDRAYSRPIRTIVGKGKTALFDVRPAERGRPTRTKSNNREREIIWTHYYAREESYSRLDYILVSPSLKAFLDPEKTFILTLPDWGLGSDHRPIKATFNLP